MGWGKCGMELSEAIPQIREHYARFGDDIPAALQLAVDTLERRLTDT